MSEQLGIGGEGVAAAAPALASGMARPRIGADRFRALADRLKKPGTVPDAAVAPTAVAAPAPAPAQSPIAVAPVVAPVPVVAPAHVAPAPMVHISPAPPLPAPAPAVAEQEPVVAAPEPVELPEEPVAEVLPEPPPVAEEPAIEALAEALASPVPIIEAVAAAEPQPVAEFVQAQPFAPILAAPAEIAAPQPQVSPLQRILATEAKPVAPQVVLPEILPPPPPPPPPRVIEENGETVVVEAPSMDVVQERLREQATSRLHQLDLENVWRQVLATPTLEERADFLREAAEILAAEKGIPVEELPAEFDLSRIESAAVEVEEPQEPAPLVTTYTENEQLETAELARSLLDMMASGSNSGLPHERALAADTLLRLLPKLAVKPLAMLSQRLAMMDNPPQLLVAKLIRDERVEVSGPLLEDCMHITDQDLAMVVAEDNAGKRRMVARRRRLSRAISDKLIATQDPSVLLTLVRNANAEISHDGFNALIEEAAKHEELMAPLSTRNDLGAPHAFELFWPAPPQLRRYLLHRFLTDSETLTKILKITLSAQATGEEGKDDIHLPSAGDVMEYLETACRGRMEVAAHKLGEALNVDAAAIQRVLLDRQGEALVVLLKAAGFPRSNVGDLLPALKRGDVVLLEPERDIEELQSMFDTLSLNKARILLTYWNWAVRKSGPYAPVH